MKKIGIMYWDDERFHRKSHETNKKLSYAIEGAGGLSMGIPSVMEEREMDYYLDYLDGVVLTGGADIAPFLYGQEPGDKLGPINLARDRSEFAFVSKIFEKKTPSLAICRGMQMANIVKGGSLYQDIASERPGSARHEFKGEKGEFLTNYHSIRVKEGSHLYQCLGPSSIVNSYHHQAIKVLAKYFYITGKSPDGIIEAIETRDDHFFIGVQFHPEFLEDAPGFENVFTYFIGGLD